MPLPKPSLDSRTFAQLLREGLAMLPQLAPHWTEQNASDPGVTLLELLAWRTEMDLYALDRLDEFYAQETRSQAEITALQEMAYNSMLSLQSSLAASINGQYIFSGGRVNNEPVAQFATSIEDFQSKWDGFDHPYPTTRSGTLLNLNATNAETGNLDFSATAGTITATAMTISTTPTSRVPMARRRNALLTVSVSSVGSGGTSLSGEAIERLIAPSVRRCARPA